MITVSIWFTWAGMLSMLIGVGSDPGTWDEGDAKLITAGLFMVTGAAIIGTVVANTGL